MLVRSLLIGVTGRANRLGRRGIMRERLDVGVTIHACERASVDGSLELRVVHVQADLLAVLVFRHSRVAMTGQTFFVAHFRGLGSGLGRGRRHRRKQQSKYNNPTATFHEFPSLSATQPEWCWLISSVFSYFFSVRMYFTRPVMSASLVFPPWAGILPWPWVMVVVRSASDLPCTGAEPRSLMPSDLPRPVSPAPVAP